VRKAEKLITSARRAAAVCGVTRFAVRVWIDRGLLPEPPWTTEQLHQVRDIAEAGPGPQAPHGTRARWSNGCACVQCRQAHSDTLRSYGRARAQDRLSMEVRRQLLAAIYAGQPFRKTLRDLELTPNRVWGLIKTDDEWSAALDGALMSAGRDDLEHGTNGGCVCKECREYQQLSQQPNEGHSTRPPRGQPKTPFRCRARAMRPGAGRSGPSSITYRASGSGPYAGGCSTCQASLVAGGCGGPSMSMLP
jgi:hypothetical protein